MSLEIRYLEHKASFHPGETVLDALEKAGADVASSCRAGACQCCMMRVIEGEVPKNSQEGLKVSLRQTGHFLSCICKPSVSLVCEPANLALFRCYVKINEIRGIGPDVALVRFERPIDFDFRPGQFLTLKRSDGLARSYSIASRADDCSTFDIHVRRIAQGRLSTWFHNDAKPGEEMWLEGPKGDCMYYSGKPEEPLTLVGTGTGISPLFAIAIDAINQGHRGPISIYHGALSEDRFYLVDELKTLANLHKNVSYIPCVVQGSPRNDLRVGDLKQIVASELTDKQLRRVYLCGDPGLVRLLKKQVFLAGISLANIHSDQFIGTDRA